MSEEQDDVKKMIADELERARRERESQRSAGSRPGIGQQQFPSGQQGQGPGDQDPQQPSPRREPTPPPTTARPPQQSRQRNADSGYRFLNPYNFIRYLDVPRPVGYIFGSCPPPPHDRYVGLTGRIVCSIETVSPLFVSDAHGMEPDAQHPEHMKYQFFKYEGRHAIPASSLRGMFRNVYEALTNSCFSIFDADRVLSHRLDSHSAPWLVPARVEPGDKLRLLTGTTRLQYRGEGGKGPGGLQYAAWAQRYWPIKPSKTLHGVFDPRYARRMPEKQENFIERCKTPMHNPDGVNHGEDCWALLCKWEGRHSHPNPAIQFWDVLEVRRKREDLSTEAPQGVPTDQLKVARGWLCVTNENIEVKHSERFFFDATPDGRRQPLLDISATVRKEYESLIVEYQERHAKAIKRLVDAGCDPGERALTGHGKNKQPVYEPGYSRFIIDPSARHLKDGDLVYAMVCKTDAGDEVAFIAPVAVPLVYFRNRIGDLLLPHKEDLCRCTELERLCPACRIFGWVSEKDRVDDEGYPLPIAYAGRLKFSHAELQGDAKPLPDIDIPLAILGTPKPTTAVFYLRPASGGEAVNDSIWEDRYDGDSRLRGRKYYRHHEMARHGEYARKEGEDAAGRYHSNKDDQNRTVCDALDASNAFRFAINFECLAQEELGALLWSLELKEGHYHRLGYAKPLGFGSVKVRVETLDLLDPTDRYELDPESSASPLAADAGLISIKRDSRFWDDCVTKFKQALTDAYGGVFEALPNVVDLLLLTGKPPLAAIHYPRSTQEPDPAGQNFEWFVENNRTRSVALPLTAEESSENALHLLGKTKRSP
jgi:CRISPR-associated protein (TIGR03986 family)